MAIENKLLALSFGALNVLGFEVWFQNGCSPDRCFPSVFEVVAKFPRRKSDSISPYFHGGNLAALCLRCVIACQMLFSPSFLSENTAMGMPHFPSENLAEFHVWCTMAPTFQRYVTTRYMKCKTDIAIPRECGPSKEQEKQRGYMDEGP